MKVGVVHVGTHALRHFKRRADLGYRQKALVIRGV